jgi:hypothetical protein
MFKNNEGPQKDQFKLVATSSTSRELHILVTIIITFNLTLGLSKMVKN